MFSEHSLEESMMEDLADVGYTHVEGGTIEKKPSDVLFLEDVESYLRRRYSSEGITTNEIRTVIQNIIVETGSLYDDNRTIFNRIREGFPIRREDKSKKDLFINLIDFDDVGNNIFKVINQFEIQGSFEKRIPDAIIFINGIPLIVFEFKSAVRDEATISDAYDQLTIRYKRDIPELFKYNAFTVISDGINNRYGSIFTRYEFFYSWPKINSEDQTADGFDSLDTMIRGMFEPARMLSILHDFVYFPDSKERSDKIICRYPQYFAAVKLHENIKSHMRPDGDGRGGTYFGSTGCGKSYAMLFLTRLLMLDPEMKNPTVVLITDRNDLDSQLSGQFVNSKSFLRDENVMSVATRDELKKVLKGRTSGGVFLTTIQKFSEGVDLLSDRCNIICISDEAHRSQLNLDERIRITDDKIEKKFGFARYLHDSLPNATYVGFTGTPIDSTLDVFGDIVDSYTMVESVKDGITVDLVYEGRAAKVNLDNDRVKAIEEYYAECEKAGTNKYQIEESQRIVSHLNVILGDPSRLEKLADDFIHHYETRVKEGSTVAGKALFVCADRHIAFELYKLIIEKRPEWAVSRGCVNLDLPLEDQKMIRKIEMLKMVMTRNKDDDPALYNELGNKEYREELDRQFKNIDSNFKIAIVVDMWLTGFDIPFLDTIYIDKPIQEHTLIQTISRVNRIYEGKTKGLIVDYIGIKNQLNFALNKYTNFERGQFEGVEDSLTIVRDKLEVLGSILHKFDSSDFFCDDPRKQRTCLKNAMEFVQKTKESEDRFMDNTRVLRQAYGLCAGSELLDNKERDRIHFYLAIRSIIRKLTKPGTADTREMNEHVRKLIEDALQSDDVIQLFETGADAKHVDIDLFSEEYLEKISRIPFSNTKMKILTKLLTQAISEYKRVNRIKSIEFSERLNNLVEKYNGRRDEASYVQEILDDMVDLIADMKFDKGSSNELGMSFEEKAFYDIITYTTNKYQFTYPEEKTREMAKRIKEVVEDKTNYLDWSKREDIKAELKVALILVMDEFGYPPITYDDVYKDILEQAENFKKNLEQ